MSDDATRNHPETGPFFEGLNQGRLLLRRCRSCARIHYYPRALCPYCLRPCDWEASSGRGTLYAFSHVTKADPVRVIAYVELEEGLRMLTNIVDAAPQDLRIGMDVTARFGHADRVVFAPG